MPQPRVVKTSFALDISPAQQKAISGRTNTAHDLISDRVGALDGVTDIRLETRSASVIYDLDPGHDRNETHRMIQIAIGQAITHLAAKGGQYITT